MQATASHLFPGLNPPLVFTGCMNGGVILLEYEGMVAISKHILNGIKADSHPKPHVIHLAINHYNLTNAVYAGTHPHRNTCGALCDLKWRASGL